MAKATKIRGIGLRHEDKIVRDEDNSFVQAYLDGRLEAGQSLRIEINDRSFVLDTPPPQDELVYIDDHISWYALGKRIMLSVDRPAVREVFGRKDVEISISLHEDGAELGRESGTVANIHHLGLREGDAIPLDLVLTDQFGVAQTVLSPTDARPLLIEVGGLWCPPSIALARDMDAYLATLGGAFRVMNLLAADEEGAPADVSDAYRFARGYGLDAPVLTGDIVSGHYGADTLPLFVLVDQATGEVLSSYTGVHLDDTGRLAGLEALEALAAVAAGEPAEGVIRIGDAQADVLAGSVRDDALHGRAGDDVLDGGLGADEIHGGDGDDLIYGGWGDDRLRGAAGIDDLRGGEGRDVLRGGDGHDYLDGGDGHDRLKGGEKNDFIVGGAGRDRAVGDAGDDQLRGGDGRDRLFGGDGDDWLEGGAGDDRLDGGRGNDLFSAGLGTDRMTGGAGADDFGFWAPFDIAIIEDFEVGTERLMFDSFHADGMTAEDVAGLASVVGAGVEIDLGGGRRIVLEGLETADGLAGSIHIDPW